MPNLFPQPDAALGQELLKAARAISLAFPLKNQHRAELPYAVRDLSRLLTTERDQKRAYWSSPRLLGAYLRYFLPWNLLRLGRLLPSLPLEFQPGGKLLDLGSGPLTLPLALWLSRPELRTGELSVCCSDTAPRPLELGRDIFRHLASQADSVDRAEVVLGRKRAEAGEPAAVSGAETTRLPRTPWKLSLLRAPLEVALRKAGRFNMITAANVLNELPTPRQESLEERLSEIFYSMDRALEPGGQLLLVEPGTRLGGKLVETMRLLALAHGFEAQSPCTHGCECPFMQGRMSAYAFGSDEDELNFEAADEFLAVPSRNSGDRGRRGEPGGREQRTRSPMQKERGKGGPDRRADHSYQPRPSGWCHFNLDTAGAPPDLLRLSAAADLEKERLHLSFVLLRKPGGAQASASAEKTSPATSSGKFSDRAGLAVTSGGYKLAAGQKMAARVVSDTIRLPGRGPGARYVCTEAGLGLLLDATGLASGGEVLVQRAKGGGVDRKTGAMELVLASR